MHPREGGRKVPFGLGKPVSRRDFMRKSAGVAAAVPLAGAFLAACSNPRETAGQLHRGGLARPDNPITLDVNPEMLIADGQKAESGPLKVYNWEQYINPRVLKEAAVALGVEIELTTFNTMNEAISKLTNANLDYDVMMGVTKDVVSRLVASDLLRPLNHSYLPNLENVWSSFTDPGKPFWDVGQNYTVPYTIYTTGIGYRVDKGPNEHITLDLAPLEESIPNMSNPYDILFDEMYKPYVHILDDYRDAIGMTILRKNYPNGTPDLNTSDPKALELARQDLLYLANTINVKADVSDYTDMPEGQSYIHQGWSGDFVSVDYYYPSWSPHDVIRYWYPESHKGEIGGDHLTLLANGKNPVLAHQFLNYMLDFDNSMLNFRWNGYVPPMKKVEDPSQLLQGSPDGLKSSDGVWDYNDVPRDLATAIPTQADFDQGYQALELEPSVDEQWKSVWEAFKTA